MKVFVIENDIHFRNSIVKNLAKNVEYEIYTFKDPGSAKLELGEKPDVLLINFPENSEIISSDISEILKFNPDIQILALCESDNTSSIGTFLSEGIFDYISLGEDIYQKINISLKNINSLLNLKRENTKLKTQLNRTYVLPNTIVGNCRAVKNAVSLLEKAIEFKNMTVSIHGESGTGKKMFAQTIHENSIRKQHPFVTVNMGAIPKERIESELFGHEKGAFNGAFMRSTGRLEQANRGTLYINEIAELDPHLQFKLFRAIQDKEITRAGSDKAIPIDTRIITGTHKNLLEEMRKGNFREDLYYKLLGLPIVLPPLVERGNDVSLLADHFLKVFCTENQLPVKKFSQESKNKLQSHNYPGNIRELHAIVELSAVLSSDEIIEEENILFSPTHLGLDIFNMDISLREFEIRIIRHFLEKYNNNVVMVAKKLEIGKSKIYNLIKNGDL